MKLKRRRCERPHSSGIVTSKEDGQALIELAFCMAFLIAPLLLGVVDVGYFIHESLEVSDAAHDGAMYAVQYFRTNGQTYPGDTKVLTAVHNAELDIPSTAYTIAGVDQNSVHCGCVAPATSTCTGVTPSTCPSAVLYVTVNTIASVNPLLPWASGGFTGAVNLKGSATFEMAP